MICYHSDGSIEIKINVCSCENCLIGDFVNCIDEKGTFIPAKHFDNEPSDSESSQRVKTTVMMIMMMVLRMMKKQNNTNYKLTVYLKW